MTRLAVGPAELAEVRAILARCVPAGYVVNAFGSRARGTAKPWSDLDLVVEGPAALSIASLAELAEAFEDSALPWKVDVVDRATVSPEFAAIIDRDKVPL